MQLKNMEYKYHDLNSSRGNPKINKILKYWYFQRVILALFPCWKTVSCNVNLNEF